MTLYEFLKTVHVISAVLWVGGGTMILIIALRMRAARDGATLMRIGQTGETLGKGFFMPLAVLQLLSGIWLVIEGDIGFEELWVVAGILGIVSSSVIGAIFLTPLSGKVAAAIEQHGFESAEVQSNLDRVFLLNRIDVVILFLVVFFMVVKPGA